MTVQQLNYVITISEMGSFNKASEVLYISQPSLTSAIQELEKEFGITIFTRSKKGMQLTKEGEEFLGYARQVLDQTNLIEERYTGTSQAKNKFSVSSQHYSFVVEAFVEMLKKYGGDKYEFHMRETQTYEIIEDVARMKSEIGVLYLNSFNETVILKTLRDNNLVFEPLFTAKPHVFIGKSSPLAKKKKLTISPSFLRAGKP